MQNEENAQWKDETFSEVQIGDKVFWRNEQGHTKNGVAIVVGSCKALVVESRTEQNTVVNNFGFDNIYLGHIPREKEVA